MRFPADFLWGASTSAYQVEGHNDASAFRAWEAKKGWEPSGAACNSWELWREDVRCLKRLNLNAYRFSVEWARVEPAPGVFNPVTLERYAEMARHLRAEGLRPIVCLHHFSEPAWLYREAPEGWLSPRAGEAYLRFVDRVLAALRSHVEDWLTFNEPMVWLLAAYALGQFPPGRSRLWDLEGALYGGGLAANVASAHERAYRRIHADVPGARVSIAQNVADLEPARPCVEDLRAVRAWDSLMHTRLLDMLRASGSLDFLGINYYTRVYVNAGPWPLPTPGRALPGYAEVEARLGPRLFRWLGGRRGGAPRSDMDWEIVPEGLARTVERLAKAYGLPILITENGVADASGEKREAFIRDHLLALGGAMERGARVLGYLHWSLLDNYEWGSYRPRFGLFQVEREKDFRRRPAAGADYYTRVAQTGIP